MFRIDNLFVEDKRLGDFLKLIAGLVKGVPTPVPADNIEYRDGKFSAKSNGANLVQVFAEHLIKSKIKTFTPRNVQDWLAKHGYSRQSSSYICQGLMKAGFIKRTGKGSQTVYTVQPRTK